MKNSLYIIIVGCGRLGSRLANRLSREGNSLVVIDKDEITFNNLSPDFSGFRIHGDAAQMATMRAAKVKNADAFIAATSEDNLNLMVAQVAKKIFNVPHVMARVFDPKTEEIYAQLGIDTVCPAAVAADKFFRAIAHNTAG